MLDLRSKLFPILGLGLLLCLAASAMGWLALHRAFDPDEFQHLQLAWLIGQGTVPYLEVFEHHTPLYHYLLAPFLMAPALTTSPDAAVAAVLGARLGGVALSLVLLLQTFFLTRKLASPAAGLLAAALLAGVTVFIEKGIEIRPDQLSIIFVLAAVMVLASTKLSTRNKMLLSGLLTALAVLAGQKALMSAPGLALAAFFYHSGKPLRAGVKNVLWQITGGLMVFVPTLAFFASQGALDAFIHDNFLLGSNWPRDPMNLVWIVYRFLRLEPLLAILAATGLVLTWRDRRFLPITAPLLALIVMMPAFPVVQRQYLLMLLPFMSVLGGWALNHLVIHQRKILIPAALAILLAHMVSVAAYESQRPNDQELNTLRTVITQSPPDSTILRSWSVGAAFRKPAFRYFSLNGEFQSLLTPADIKDLEAILQNPTTAPALIEMDEAMRAMPAPIVTLIEKGWGPTGTATLYQRKTQ